MAVEINVVSMYELMSKRLTSSRRPHSQSVCDLKARQAMKIREIGQELVALNILTLDHQAEVLGLLRSTTWTILKGNYKSSGLSATVINRMLASGQLPLSVRAKVLEYVAEKVAGQYGHNENLRRKFVSRLSAKQVNRAHLEQMLGARRERRKAKGIAA